jgi:hypothetical protein
MLQKDRQRVLLIATIFTKPFTSSGSITIAMSNSIFYSRFKMTEPKVELSPLENLPCSYRSGQRQVSADIDL